MQNGKKEFFSFGSVEISEIVHHGALLKITADGRIGQKCENIVMLTEPVGNCIIPLTVIEFVMIYVVRRFPGKCGKSIKQGYMRVVKR